MLDHVSITVSDIPTAERFYDAIMKVLGVVKVGRRDDWLGYGERARASYPDRIYLTIRKGTKPDDAFGRHWCFKAKWRTESTRSGTQASPPAAAMTGRPACAIIMRRTMRRSSGIPTATGSRRSATRLCSGRICPTADQADPAVSTLGPAFQKKIPNYRNLA
jgi:hypothetical protein